MKLLRQLPPIVCYLSALWLLATARSCSYATNLLSSMSVTDANRQGARPTGKIFGELAEESEGSVCRLNQTCCSVKAQEFMRQSVSRDYHNRISDIISMEVLECYNHNITGAFIQYLANRKNHLVQSMLRTFGVYFHPYVTLYDDFYAYLQETVMTGNICQLETKFKRVFFEIFLAAYISNPTSGSALNLLNTEVFRICVYDYFLELKGEDIATWYTGFTRSYNRTMYYYRALRTADAILESLLSHQLTNPCRTTLMKMSHCAQCAGYGNNTHCQGMCLNSLRGCLVDLSDLASPFRKFSDAVIRMKNSLENVYSPWVQFDILESHFYSMVSTSFAQAAEVAQVLSHRCTAVGPRSKRQAPATGVYLGTRVSFQPPRTNLNQSAHCYRGLFAMLSHIPELLCGDKGESNQNCWNGQTIGSYDREVIDFNRQSQHNNPEVLTCRQQRHKTEILQLKVVTQELNLLSGFYTCLPDDEDCMINLDAMCDFQAPIMTLDTNDGSGDFYSSSGVDDVFEEAPSNPNIIMTVSQSPMSVTFTWTQPVGETVDNYEIALSYQGPCSGFTFTNTMIMDGATREQTLTGLQEFSTYTIDISAVNCVGRSVTTSQNITTVAAAPTASPQAVTVSATGSTSISIDWNHVDCIERNSEITGYILLYNSTDGTAKNISLPANTTTYTVTGLTPSTNYSVGMAAINSDGEVGPSTFPILVKTLPLTILNGTTIPDHGFVLLEDIGGVIGIYHCKIPRQDAVDTLYAAANTGASNITSLQFQLTSELNATTPMFTLTCTSTGGTATTVSWRVNNHTVTEDSAHHITSQKLRDPVTATYNHTLMVTGRRTGKYECTVSNNKPSSASRMLMVVGASPPTNFSAVQAGPTSIQISWIPPAFGATVVGYWINYQAERAQDSSVNHGTVDIGACATQHILPNLQQGLLYTITMVTKSRYLPSTVAGPVYAVTAVIRLKVVNATALLVSWDALRNTHNYTIYYGAFSPELFKFTDELKIVVPSTKTSDIVVIRELAAGVEHQFQVTSSLEVRGEVYETERSFPTKIVFDEAEFRLQMGPVSPCTTWSTDKAEKIRSYVHSGIAKAISFHCNCSFPMEFVRKGFFRCWNAPDRFTYRSAIVGTEAHNATELVQFLEEWVILEPALQVDQFELWVDTKCPVLIKLKGEDKC